MQIWSISEEGIYCEQVEEVKDQINNLVVVSNIACFVPQGGGVKVNKIYMYALCLSSVNSGWFDMRVHPQLHSWNGSSKLLNQNKNVKCLALVQGKLYCGCQDTSIQVFKPCPKIYIHAIA